MSKPCPKRIVLFRVFEDFDGVLVLASVRAERRSCTDRLIDHERAFGHVDVVPIGTHAESADEAITRYQTEQLRTIERLQREIERAGRLIEASRKLGES